MKYSRQQHKKFIDSELESITEQYRKLIKSEAIALLYRNEVYVTQFVKVNFTQSTDVDGSKTFSGNGQLMLKFKRDRGIPRKNEYFTAVVLEGKMGLPTNWGSLSWVDLRRNHQVEFSEVHCVWQGKADERGFLLCGFHGISIEMAFFLQRNPNCVVVLGPQDPPIDYYQNLISIVKLNNASLPISKILDYDEIPSAWNPKILESSDKPYQIILEELNRCDDIIIQGPPGTGKTYMMAQIVSSLLDDGKSVLVTALTNRALIELAMKPVLKQHLAEGKVMKTNISTDELSECPKLVLIDSKEISCIPGMLSLATFYNSSGWAKDAGSTPPFDYVIMDEASQALFAMIAACKKLGKKVVWIGDQNQLPPIITMKEELLVRNDYAPLANGFQTLCDNFNFSSFILTDSYRLLPRAAELTSIFYSAPLRSVANFQFEKTTLQYVNKEGGAFLVTHRMPNGEKADMASCEFVINLLKIIREEKPKAEIAILAKFRATVRMLQNTCLHVLGNMDNVLIDTVERIQGMTCDICIYFIPNTMCFMSLNKSLFNVATSRAKQYTLIVADPSIMIANCDNEVSAYLECLSLNNLHKKVPVQDENAPSAVKSVISSGNIQLTVVDKVDLSKFERKKVEINEYKNNYYLIDTNVFINCPDIITKIGEDYPIILSAKVTDELDKMKVKLDDRGKRNAERALRVLNNEVKHKIIYEFADVSLLPDDFDKRSPDNMILSVALKYKDENPIILTSDNGLQLKAKLLGITTISLRKFLKH